MPEACRFCLGGLLGYPVNDENPKGAGILIIMLHRADRIPILSKF